MQRTYQLAEIAPTRADDAMAALLRQAGRRIDFAAGAVIQRQGDAGDGFWLVESGDVSLCRFGQDGAVTVFAVLGAGDLFGELAHFTGVARQVDALAENASTLLRIDAPSVSLLLKQEPDFARWLLRSLANQLRVALNQIESERHLSVEARVARTLAAMARREGPALQTTQEALANFVGVCRVTIGQILARLARAGVVELGYRRIVVRDLGALGEI